MSEKSVYYAHPISLYNTAQEKRDLEVLAALGLRVLNPNSQECDEGYRAAKAASPVGDGMGYFKDLVEGCSFLAFRAFHDGTIPAGVLKEIRMAQAKGIPVIELPAAIARRGLTVEQTREALAETGCR